MAMSEIVMAEPPDESAKPPRGYTLVLPPGWSRIPLRKGTEQAIGAIVDRSFAGLPRDKIATLRRELQLRLREMAAQTRESAGLDLYVPTERMHDVAVAASLVVAEISLVTVDQIDPETLLAGLIADSDDTRPVELDRTAGTRTEHIAEPDPEQGIEKRARRVDYVLPVPQAPERYLLATFNTLGAQDPRDELADLLVELFDALMTTFRWRQP